MTPYEKWKIGEQERIIKHPVDPGYLDVVIGHPENRRVFHYGVQVNSLYYNSPQLQFLLRRHGQHLKVDLKYYEDNLTFIHVFDPYEKMYFMVQAIDKDYVHGLRLIQHEAIRRALIAQTKNPDDREVLLKKKEELQQIVNQAIHHKKMVTRKRSAVFQGRDSRPIEIKEMPLQQQLNEEDFFDNVDLPSFDIHWRNDIETKDEEKS